MSRLVLAAGMVLALGVASAGAGPCSSAIAQIEQAVSAPNSQYGPTARQSVGAQDSRQPTAASIAAAQKQADNHYDQVLAKAKTLDAAGNSDCQSVVKELKLLVGIQ